MACHHGVLIGLLLLGASAGAACFPTASFMCGDSTQCQLGGARGSCEPTGYCSYDDDVCPSGRRYHEDAPPGLAGRCVGADGDESSTTTSPLPPGETSADTAHTTESLPTCGDGVLDEGEGCDDGDRLDDDACNRRCEPAGDVQWETSPQIPGDDAALAVIPDGDGFIVGGVAPGGIDQDLVVTRYAADTLVWQGRYDGPGPDGDSMGALVRREDGSLFAVGSVDGRPGVLEIDARGGLTEARTESARGEWRAAAAGPRSTLIAAGRTDLERGAGDDILVRCYRADFSDCGELVVSGAAADGVEQGAGVVVQDPATWVVGSLAVGPGIRTNPLLLRLDAGLAEQSRSVVEETALSGWSGLVASLDGTRLFASGFFDAGSGLRQIRIGAFEDGALVAGRRIERDLEGTDFGRAVAVDSLGQLVVVGEIDRDPTPQGRDYTAWVGKFTPALEPIWERTLAWNGARARAVAVDAQDRIVVVGDFATATQESESFVTVLTP